MNGIIFLKKEIELVTRRAVATNGITYKISIERY